MRSGYKQLGNYIRQVKTKNVNGAISKLRGISIEKRYMPSAANINGVDLTKYKVVNPGQFAFNPMHVGRDEILPICLLDGDEAVIVSPAYTVFEIVGEEILPEYLMMWFRRSEFDRNAWFKTDGNVRGGLSWDDFCKLRLPVPPPIRQVEKVKEYKAVVNRIALIEKQSAALEEALRTIYNETVSSEGISKTFLSELVIHRTESINTQLNPEAEYYHYSLPSFDNNKTPKVEKGHDIKSTKYRVFTDSILVSKLNPNFPRIWPIGKAGQNYICSTEFQVLIPRDPKDTGLILAALKSKNTAEYLRSKMTGTSNSHQRVKPQDIMKVQVPIITGKDAEKFHKQSYAITKYLQTLTDEVNSLRMIRELLPSLLASDGVQG